MLVVDIEIYPIYKISVYKYTGASKNCINLTKFQNLPAFLRIGSIAVESRTFLKR